MKSRILTCVVFILSITAIPAGWTSSQHNEFKFSIPEIKKIPGNIREALITGKTDKEIVKRGVVIQKYIAPTKANLSYIVRFMARHHIPFGDHDEIHDFLEPGHTHEIRIIHRYLKDSEGKTVENHQIRFASGRFHARKFIETEIDNAEHHDSLGRLYSAMENEVINTVFKIHFEKNLHNKNDGHSCKREEKETKSLTNNENNNNGDKQKKSSSCGSVDVSILTKPAGKHVQSCFAFGEIVYPFLKHAHGERSPHPDFSQTDIKEYLGRDISSRERARVRNIALYGVPDDLMTDDGPIAEQNSEFANQLLAEFSSWIPEHIISSFYNPHHRMAGKTALKGKKILLNAEPFGFGPTAAIAEIFPYLRENAHHLGYIGEKHTLNLQNKLTYDELFDCTTTPLLTAADHALRKECYLKHIRQYDVLITASDFEIADLAKAQGLKVIIYDPLAWYWQEIPAAISRADLYLAQNFLMVEERIRMHKEKFPETIVVPPIVSGLHRQHEEQQTNDLLVNTGGLMNPLVEPQVLMDYAQVILSCAHKNFSQQYDHVHYTGSRALAETLQRFDVKTLQPHQVQTTLEQSKLALMTSGLGNIFEAASMAKKVIWLPPANDSQGQQLRLLQRYNLTDGNIDWHDIFADEEPIDYFAAQPDVLNRITKRVKRLVSEPAAQKRLCAQMAAAAQSLNDKKNASLATLAEYFSYGGGRVISDEIVHWLKKSAEVSLEPPLKTEHSVAIPAVQQKTAQPQ